MEGFAFCTSFLHRSQQAKCTLTSEQRGRESTDKSTTRKTVLQSGRQNFRAMSAPIPPDQLEYYERHASDNQQPNLIATIILCLALPCIAVFLRFIARWRTRASYKADDWLILLALVGILRPARTPRMMRCFSDRHIASIGRYVDHHRSRYPLRRGQAYYFR